jgi:hypothetical protein
MNMHQAGVPNARDRSRYRVVVGFALLGALAFMLSRCAGDIVTEWTEQVQLSDGRIIEIEQRTVDERVGPWGAGEALPISNMIRFKASFSNAPEWQDVRVPILLDLDARNGEIVIICTSNDGRVWNGHGRPKPPYWQFRLHDGRWIEQPLDVIFFGRDANLIPDSWWLRKHRGLVTLEQKRRWFDEKSLASWFASIDPNARIGFDSPKMRM